MNYTTMMQLYEMSKERGERLLQEQTQLQLSRGAPWGVSTMQQCARFLIRAGLGLQRYGQAVERRTQSPYHSLTATVQELQISR